MNRPDVHTLTGAYATDALDAAERSSFEQHLAACPDCVDEVNELQETAARLGTAAAAPAPAGLRARVLAEIATVRQLPPAGAEPAPRATTDSGRERRLRRWALAAAACLAVFAMGLGGISAHLYNDLQDSRADQARLAAVLSAGDARTATASAAGGVSGTVVVSRARGEAAFLVSALPAVPKTQTYQLWLVGPDGPRSAGLLKHDGHAARPVIAHGLSGADAIAVTVEPAGGSEQPTTDPVLVVPLPRA